MDVSISILQSIILKINLLIDFFKWVDDYFTLSFAFNKSSRKLTPLPNNLYLVPLWIAIWFIKNWHFLSLNLYP